MQDFPEVLKLIGIKDTLSAPFVLPARYGNYTEVTISFSLALEQINASSEEIPSGGASRFFLFRVKVGEVLHDAPSNPFIVVNLVCESGEAFPAVFFSGKRQIRFLAGKPETIYVGGKIAVFEGEAILDECEIVPPDLVGQVVPYYKGLKTNREQDLVRSLIRYTLDQHQQEIETQCVTMEEQIRKGGYDPDILMQTFFGCAYRLWDLVHLVHTPPSIEMAGRALSALELLNHLYAVVMVREQTRAPDGHQFATEVNWEVFEKALQKMPYRLTDEQRFSAQRLLEVCALPTQGQIILSADVGMGKTSVFGVAAYTLAKSAKSEAQRVAIMAPNSILVKQIAADLKGWFPDLRVEVLLGGGQSTPDGIEDADVIVSTTSLLSLSQKTGMRYALSIVDEEQKMGARQRELLATYSQNYLASTATLVPRTMQLAQLQSYEVLRLTRSHVRKTIHTRIVDYDGLMKEVIPLAEKLVEDGHQIIVIYPAATEKNTDDSDQADNYLIPDIVRHVRNRSAFKNAANMRLSAESGKAFWEQFFPGQVGFVHGKMEEEDKADILQKMRSGKLSVLVGTTVLEAGITIPGVRMAVVMESENFGLSNLHQIRGRVARSGGEGWFFLHTDTESDTSLARLEVLEKETDGYKIAERDLELRGFGDLRRFAKDQSGEVMRGFLPNEAIKVRTMQRVLGLFVSDREEAEWIISEKRREMGAK